MIQYFPKPYKHFGGVISVKVKVDLSNYATKTDLKKVAVIDTCKLAAKAEVDKLDIDKLVPAPVDLSKLTGKL